MLFAVALHVIKHFASLLHEQQLMQGTGICSKRLGLHCHMQQCDVWCEYIYLVPSFRLMLTMAPNVAAIVPMIAGRFFAVVSLMLKTCK